MRKESKNGSGLAQMASEVLSQVRSALPFKHRYSSRHSNVLNGLYSQEFQDEHPPPANVNRLGDLLYFYLKHISEEYQTLTTIFPLGTGETTL